MVKFCPVLFNYVFCWYEGNQYTPKPMAEFSLVLGTAIFTPWSAEDLDLALEILYCWITSWQLLAAGVSQTALFHCPAFPGCSPHSLPLTGWRAAGVGLGAPTHMHTECPGWREGMSSNPCRGMEVPIAAAFLGMNGSPTSETAHPAPAPGAAPPVHPAELLFTSVAALGFSSFHPAPRNQDGLSAHASLKPSSDTCL